MKIEIHSKIFFDYADFEPVLRGWKASGEVISFTNGCFDLIHHGHVDSLIKSAEYGTRLIVGLNSDASVSLLKGKGRPLLDGRARAKILAA
ncbi:MAG: adenylyltransferase/cytidyltransferase family protein, partial [Mariniphaga sp.]